MGDDGGRILETLDDYPKICLMGTVNEEMVRDYLHQYAEHRESIRRALHRRLVEGLI